MRIGEAEYHEAPKVGQIIGPGKKVVKGKGVTRERVVQRARRWTAQNEMKSVLRPMIAAIARRIQRV